MYNLVIFCKTYSTDFNRFKNLKESVDKFNVDNIPFFISCPKNEIKMFEALFSGNEKYIHKIISDLDINNYRNIEEKKYEQNWCSQQVIKLMFYKLGFCEHYAIFDSEAYFIKNFYITDFMYDTNTPYFQIVEHLVPDIGSSFIKNYLGREGKYYDFIYNSRVFSKIVLENMEEKLLKPNNMTFNNLIELCPYEFNWYGEWFLKCNLIPFYYSCGKMKIFYLQKQYNEARRKGLTEKDFIDEGYFGILLNNRWVNDVKYKHSLFYFLIKKIKQFFKRREK